MIIYKEKNVCIIYLLVLFSENKMIVDVAKEKNGTRENCKL